MLALQCLRNLLRRSSGDRLLRARARTFAHAQQMCVKTKSVQNLRNLVQLFWGNFCASLIQYTGTCAPLDKSAHKSCSKVVVVVVVRTCALAQATLRLSPSKINIYLYKSSAAAAAASLCAAAGSQHWAHQYACISLLVTFSLTSVV